jgi:hypothetical protein
MAEYETRTLQHQIDMALDELKSYILDNPNEPENDYYETITELADGAGVTYTYDALVIAGDTLWLATTRPENAPSDATAFDLINLNITEHVYEKLNDALDELRDELTPHCEECGKRTPTEHMTTMYDDAHICTDCAVDYPPDEVEVYAP